jgi:hypothetical protein
VLPPCAALSEREQDDQSGAVIDPEAEGAEPGVAPDIVIVEPDAPLPD